MDKQIGKSATFQRAISLELSLLFNKLLAHSVTFLIKSVVLYKKWTKFVPLFGDFQSTFFLKICFIG